MLIEWVFVLLGAISLAGLVYGFTSAIRQFREMRRIGKNAKPFKEMMAGR